MAIKAMIFDVDGTLAETEDQHRKAFNQAFTEFNIPWQWGVELYTKLLEVTGGKERLAHYAQMVGYEGLDVVKTHERKTEIYVGAMTAGNLQLRTGVEEMIKRLRDDGYLLGIATTTSRVNVDVLLKATLGESAIGWFSFYSCGDHAKAKKPDPEIYINALNGLGVNASEALAFEDSEVGLLSATRAGIKTIITPSIYTLGQDFSKAIQVADNMNMVSLPSAD